MKRKLFKSCAGILSVSCIVWLAGCLPFPLGSAETSKLDPKMEGFWLTKQDDGKQTLVALYPYDSHAYVMQWTDFNKAGDEMVPTNIQTFKAWLTPVKDARFITMEPLPQRLASSNSEKKVYMVARLVPEGDGLLVKPIDGDFKPFENAKNAEDIAAIITQNLADPKLYGKDPAHFRHMDLEKDKDALEPMLKLFK